MFIECCRLWLPPLPMMTMVMVMLRRVLMVMVRVLGLLGRCTGCRAASSGSSMILAVPLLSMLAVRPPLLPGGRAVLAECEVRHWRFAALTDNLTGKHGGEAGLGRRRKRERRVLARGRRAVRVTACLCFGRMRRLRRLGDPPRLLRLEEFAELERSVTVLVGARKGLFERYRHLARQLRLGED